MHTSPLTVASLLSVLASLSVVLATFSYESIKGTSIIWLNQNHHPNAALWQHPFLSYEDIDELEKYIRTKSFRIALFRNKYSSLDTGLDHNREPTGGKGDGQLTFDEVHNHVRVIFKEKCRIESRNMMNDLDADSDGLISRQETMRPANEEGTHTLLFDSATSLILRPDYSEILFKAADRNKDGWLAESEMTAYLNPLYEAHMHRALAHDIIEEMKRRMGAAELKIRDLVSQSKLLQKKANEYAVLMDGTANVNVLVPLLRALALEKSQQISQHYFEVADSDQDGTLGLREMLKHLDLFYDIAYKTTDGDL